MRSMIQATVALFTAILLIVAIAPKSSAAPNTLFDATEVSVVAKEDKVCMRVAKHFQRSRGHITHLSLKSSRVYYCVIGYRINLILPVFVQITYNPESGSYKHKRIGNYYE